MHQDGRFVGVHVELDDISLAVTVQQLITWEQRERDRTTSGLRNLQTRHHYVSDHVDKHPFNRWYRNTAWEDNQSWKRTLTQ